MSELKHANAVLYTGTKHKLYSFSLQRVQCIVYSMYNISA